MRVRAFLLSIPIFASRRPGVPLGTGIHPIANFRKVYKFYPARTGGPPTKVIGTEVLGPIANFLPIANRALMTVDLPRRAAYQSRTMPLVGPPDRG